MASGQHIVLGTVHLYKELQVVLTHRILEFSTQFQTLHYRLLHFFGQLCWPAELDSLLWRTVVVEPVSKGHPRHIVHLDRIDLDCRPSNRISFVKDKADSLVYVLLGISGPKKEGTGY